MFTRVGAVHHCNRLGMGAVGCNVAAAIQRSLTVWFSMQRSSDTHEPTRFIKIHVIAYAFKKRAGEPSILPSAGESVLQIKPHRQGGKGCLL